MNDSTSIFGLGTVVVDHQVFIKKHPELDEKTTVLTDRFQIGGPVPTALALLSKFGHQTHFIGEWGKDHFGAMIEEDFVNSGIQFLADCSQKEIQTGFAHVWIEQSTGKRTISCKRPEHEFLLRDQDRENLKSASVLHLDGWPEKTSLEAAQIVKDHQGLVVLDSGSLKPATQSLIPLVDVLNCPSHFSEQLFGDDDPVLSGQKLLKLGPNIVTITQGQKGAFVFTDGGHQFIPSISVEAVDTTGAGDVFCGGLIYSLLEEMNSEDAVRFASVTAALKCRKTGNREALPEKEEVLSLLDSK